MMGEARRQTERQFAELEKKALALVNSDPNLLDEHQVTNTKALIHQLQVYQVELEIQNEELRASQEELMASRDRFSYLYHQAPVGYVSVDENGLIREANQRIAKMMRVSLDKVLNKPMGDFIYPADRDIFLGRFRALFRVPTGKSMELRLRCGDDSLLYVLVEGRSEEFDEGGREKRALVLLSISDITIRKEAEANLRLADKIIHSAQESILVTDHRGSILNVNPCFESITGYRKEEVVGKNPSLLQSGRQGKPFYDTMWKEIARSGVWQGVVWNKRKNGEEYAERLTINAIYGEHHEVTHYVGIFTDITDQLALEQQLRHAQKVEAIGTLVGGIAHDFNNMLNGINGNMHLLKNKVKKAGVSADVIEKIIRVEGLCGQAGEMISRLLSFSRKGIVDMKRLSFSAFVREALKLAQVTIPENVQVEYDITSEAVFINGDAAQLQQVLLNLLNNARDAVEHTPQPCIRVSLSRHVADREDIALLTTADNRQWAHLSIADNGCGIAAADMEQVFDPFFTTKEVGKGTGLGLSMVYGAVQSHLGLVHVDSDEGKGTTIHVYIPLMDAPAMEADVAAVAPAIASGSRQGAILLADDEARVREPTAEVLEDFGYQVLLAEDGMEAMDLFHTHQEKIALVMLDVVMPRLGGLEAAAQIRSINREMPILFVTGYDKAHVLGKGHSIENSEIITKPVNFDALHGTIRTLIDGNYSAHP